ncbi:hypothetical protein, partial [Paenibacillus apiarius]|uniref:hypothetical protein n=1 Tax=Paenibacillus apiarius TaxID=46240 RepID=UPI003B3B28F9
GGFSKRILPQQSFLSNQQRKQLFFKILFEERKARREFQSINTRDTSAGTDDSASVELFAPPKHSLLAKINTPV